MDQNLDPQNKSWINRLKVGSDQKWEQQIKG